MKHPLVNGLVSFLLPLSAYAGYSSRIGKSYATPQPMASSALLLGQPAGRPDQGTNALDISSDELEIKQGVAFSELVIIDGAIADKRAFYQDLKPNVKILEIDFTGDAIQQLVDAVKPFRQLAAVHLVTHAEKGRLYLGDVPVSAESMENNPTILAGIRQALKPGGDLLLYGCDLGQGAEGQQFLDIIKGQGNVDVAASDNKTGNGIDGSDWNLEIVRGDVDRQLPFSEKALKDFSGVLAFTGTIDFSSVVTGGSLGGASTVDAQVSEGSYTLEGDGNSASTYAGFGRMYTSNNETSITLFFTGGETFNASSIYLYNVDGSNDTFTVTSNLGGSVTTGSIADRSGVNVNLSSLPTGITSISISTADASGYFSVDNFAVVDVGAAGADSDGDLTASATVTEPVGIATTVDTVGEAVDVFDFTLSDGGTADGNAMTVSAITVDVSGTTSDAIRDQVTWRLDGNDASNVTGTYNAGSDTITFTGLSISIADGTSETYTVNAYYNDNTGLTEDQTFILSVDGDTDVTVGGAGTQMGSTSAVTNGAGSTVDVTATTLAVTTQPAGSTSGSTLTTQPVITARDAFGNTDVDFTEIVTLTESSAGTLSGDVDIAAVSGVATFTDVAYTASADQESFTLTANDEDGVDTDLATVDANTVTSDVVATQLVYDTQPAPLTVQNGVAESFTTVPVVSARDANNTVDTGYSTDITLAEVNGAGSATMTATGDTDGNGATVSITPSSGVSTFTNLNLTYTNSGGSDETFNLQASSGGLSTVNSSQLTSTVTDSDGDLTAAGGVSEPVGLDTTVDTMGEAVDVFDFTLSDGGTADGDAMTVSAITVNVSGTTSDTIRDQVTWRLNGSDASNVTGTYNAGSDTITFSGLSISIADGTSETYTVNAYYNDNAGLTEDQTFIFSVDGDTDVTVGGSGTQMGATTAVTNGAGSTVDITASTLVFTTQPAGSVSGSALTTQPVITARDAFGNTDVDFTETVTLTEASAGTLSGDVDITAVSGVATFTDVAYTATADQQSFTLTGNDDDGTGTNLATVDANAVTADVVATKLAFSTEPAPTSIESGNATSFTTVPIVSALDANDLVDTGYSTDIALSVTDPNDGTVDGTVNSLSGTGDSDGSGTTVTLTPGSGVATYTGLALTYTNNAVTDTIALRATSGGLTAVNSTDITSLLVPTVTDDNISIGGGSGTGGAFVTGDTVTVSWNNTAGGDNNSGITAVTVDFSDFGGGAAVAASNSSDTWTATYTITAGAIDSTNLNVSVTATSAGGSDTTADTTNATVDNQAPVVTDGNLSISGASGTGGAFITGDTVTATWDDTASGDNNSDTVSSVTVDFSAFGGGSAVSASNSSDIWTATYTLVAGAIDSTNLNISATATDNAGNSTTTADTTNATADNVAPTLSDAGISITSTGTGTGGAYITGDTVTVEWDDTATGDNNSDTVASATVDFSAFGGGAAVAASNSSDTWTASYTVIAGAIDATNLNASVTATDNAGNTTTIADSSNLTLDNTAPTLTDGNLSISGGSGTGGAFITGDTVTASWDNTASGDNNSDTVASVTADFSAFGGGAAVAASNSSDTWTATYTIVAGAIDSTNVNVSATATDNAGNTTTTADTTNATVDNQALTVTDGNLSLSGASGSGGAFILGDTVTASWDNTASGDNNTDTVAAVSVDFSAFGGGAAVAASNSSDTWSATYTLTAGSTTGSNLNVSLSATDNAGNQTTQADTSNATTDVSVPSVSSVTSSTANGSYNAGDSISIQVVFSDSVTVSGTPQLTLETGTTDQVVDYSSGSGGTTLTFTYTVQAGDTSSDLDYTSTSALALNSGTINDASGNPASLTLATPGAANSLGANKALVIDTDVPTLAEVTAVPTPASDTTPDYTFSTTETGTLSVGGSCGTSSSTTLASTGNHTITLTQTDNTTALADGDYSDCTLTVTDGAGNASTALTITSFTVDTTAPSAPDAPDLDAASDTGSSDSDNITSDTTPTLSGTAEANATVAVSSDQDGALGSVSADGTGNWSFTPGSALSEATHSITATATDTAGNASGASSALSVTIDTTAPATPAAPDMDSGSDSGVSDSDDITNDATPDLTGSTEANATVAVSSDQDGALGNATADGSGNWSLTATGLSDATHSITFTATDVAGNTSASSAALSITLDTAAPTVSTLSPADGAGAVQYDDDLVITFNENIAAGSGASDSFDLYLSSDSSLYQSLAVGDADVTVSGTTVTINPNNFTPTESYYVQIGNQAVQDTAGNLYAGISDTTSWNFTLDNNLPQVSDDTATTDEDSAVAIDVLANDSDEDSTLNPASVTVTSGPTNGSTSVNTANGFVTYTPDADYNGNDSFTYTVEDLQGGSSVTATVTVTINAVNDAPVATNDMASTAEDTAVSINVASNDSDIDTGDSVDTGSLAVVTGPSDGSAVVSAGEILYTPDANFNGSDSFTYTIDDSTGATSNTATVIVNVTSVNDLPTASDDSTSTDEDNAVNISVLTNDSDLDGTLDATSVTIMTDATNGSTSVDVVSGVVTYTPNSNYNGNDSFTYVVQDDSSGTSNAATVSITVNAVNDAPVAVADTAVLLEDTAHTINAKGNDSDVDNVNADLTLVVVDTPTQGNVVINSGAFVYTPDADFNGNDSFTYKLTDPDNAESNTVTVTLTIQSVNDDPIANDDTVQTDEDTDITISPLVNDSDGDGTLDASTLSITSQPVNGQLTDNADGTVTYSPDENFNGNDSFSYQVQDNEAGTSNVATVSITINAVNDNPVAVDDTAVVDEDSSVVISPLDNDSDVDGTLASLSIDMLAANGSVLVNPDNTVTYTPDVNFDGSDNFTYQVTDNLGGTSTSATVSITVNHVNSDPVITGTPDTSVLEDSAYSFVPTLSDQDEDTLTVTATNLPGWLNLDSATGEISGIPDNSNVGVYNNITLTVDDGETTASLTAFDITVVNTNDAPVANNDSYSLDEGALLNTSALDGVLVNDVDVDGNAIQATLVTSPRRASSFSFNPDGTFSYQHNGGESATDSFTYRISDGMANSGDATVTFTINPVNEPPQFTTTPTQTMVVQGEVFSYQVAATDPDSQAQISIQSGPDWLTLRNGLLSGTAPLDTTGAENITLVASDGEFSVPQNFTIDVVAREQAQIQISTLWDGTPAVVGDDIALGITLSHLSGPAFSNGSLSVRLTGSANATLNGCSFVSSNRWQCPVNLAPSGSVSWQLNLTPAAVGDVVATLKLFDQDSEQLKARVTDASIGEAVVAQGNDQFNLSEATAIASMQLLPDVAKELVAGTNLGNSVKLLDYDLDTGTAEEIGEITNNGETEAIIVADLNNDTLSDIIVVNSSGAASGVYYNQGGLVFTEDAMNTDFAQGSRAIVQDLNDDTFPEILIGGNGATLYVYENQNGVINDRPYVLNAPAFIRHFAVLNRDSSAAWSGRVVLSSNSAVYLLNYTIDELAEPSGLIWAQDLLVRAEALVTSTFQLNIPNVSSLQVVDLDGDGEEEVVAGNTHTDDSADATAVNVLAVTVSDELESVATLGGASSSNVDVGDFNGDGEPDLMVTNENDTHQIYLGSGTVNSFTPKGTVISKTSALSLTDDLNGDGLADVLIYDDGEDTVDVFISTGDGDIGTTTDLRASSEIESLSDSDYRFRYSLTIENLGDESVEDVLVRIQLPSGLSVESLAADCVQPEDQLIRCNLATFDSGESRRFDFVLRGESGVQNKSLVARLSSAALETAPEDNTNTGALSGVFGDVEVSVKGGGSSGGSMGYLLLLALGVLAWQRKYAQSLSGRIGLPMVCMGLAGAFLLSAKPAHAWQWDRENLYAEVVLGKVNSSWSESSFGKKLDAVTQQGEVESETSRTGFNLIAGYDINEHWSAELGYLDWGTIKVEVSGVTANLNDLRDLVSNEYPMSGDGFYLGGKYRFKLDERAHAFFKLGLWNWEGEYDVTLGNERFDVEDSGTDALIGAGVSYPVYEQFHLTLQMQLVSMDDSTESLIGMGTQYHF